MNNPIAKMHTDFGIITFELYPQYAPKTVNSFIWSAQQGFYNNRLIKRVVKDFVLQQATAILILTAVILCLAANSAKTVLIIP